MSGKTSPSNVCVTYAFDFVCGLVEGLLAGNLVEDELDLPHDGLRLTEMDGPLDRGQHGRGLASGSRGAAGVLGCCLLLLLAASVLLSRA
jgi:hypothetical protein